MEEVIGESDQLKLNESDVYVINNNMEIFYLKGVKLEDETYHQKEREETNENQQ